MRAQSYEGLFRYPLNLESSLPGGLVPQNLVTIVSIPQSAVLRCPCRARSRRNSTSASSMNGDTEFVTKDQLLHAGIHYTYLSLHLSSCQPDEEAHSDLVALKN